ncbi:MAG: hypothetical protein H7X84_06260 [Verrucomicrobia bacterium]|nr:hypothetical protein [Prolixibacteraceae bacterium]
MILTEKNRVEITQKNLIKKKDLRGLIFKYYTNNNQYTALSFHMSNFENDLFIVDWQLSVEEKSGIDKSSN